MRKQNEIRKFSEADEYRKRRNDRPSFSDASSDRGGGFCVYADITVALRNLLDSGRIKTALIVDLDAHQVRHAR